MNIDDMSDVVRFDIQMRLKYNFQCQLSHSLSELNIEKWLRLLSIAVMRKVKLVCLLIILIGSIVSSTLYPHLCNSYCEEIPLRTTPSRTTQHNREMRFPGDPNYANFYSAYLKRERKFQCTKTGFERCAMQITIAIKFVLISERYRLNVNNEEKKGKRCRREAKCAVT
ncbi:hypothetical protein T03_7650, partial [Trichinella britovi]